MDQILSQYSVISLDEMEGIKLMNRTDTKFVTTVPMLKKVLQIAMPDYFVQEVEGVRNIPYYSLYFDTPEYRTYVVHEKGHLFRQKVRMRSYINSKLNYLEVKTKNNHKRTKKKRVEAPFFLPQEKPENIRFTEDDPRFSEFREFLGKKLLFPCETLSESVENQFTRITLVNKKKTERLTIDTNLKFHNIRTDNRYALDNIVIIELKRDGLQPSPILGVLRQLRIKPMGFSKYCMGCALTDPSLMTNRFKVRLRTVDKMNQQKNK